MRTERIFILVAVALLIVNAMVLWHRPAGVGGPVATTPPPNQLPLRTQSREDLESYLNPRRYLSEPPDRIISEIGLKAGDTILDLGAGSGYFTACFSRAVGPKGQVYAVDVERNAIDFLRERKERAGWYNVRVVCNGYRDVNGYELPGIPDNSLDFVFCGNVHLLLRLLDPATPRDAAWRDLDRFYGIIYSKLKPGGRLVHIEQRPEANPHGNLTEAQTIGYIEGFGSGRLFKLQSRHDFQDQLFLIFSATNRSTKLTHPWANQRLEVVESGRGRGWQ